jgi:hypothetical protein
VLVHVGRAAFHSLVEGGAVTRDDNGDPARTQRVRPTQASFEHTGRKKATSPPPPSAGVEWSRSRSGGSLRMIQRSHRYAFAIQCDCDALTAMPMFSVVMRS